jgi:hypothetical protein
MNRAVIDFESYYDDDISVVTLGNARYTEQTDAYAVSLAINGEVVCGTLAEMSEMCAQVIKDPGVQVWAANSNFDWQWATKYWGESAHPWKCVLDLGAYHQLPRNLAQLTKKVLGVSPNKEVRSRMKGIRYESLSDKEQNEVLVYCADDSRYTDKLIDALRPMSAIEGSGN